MAKILILSLPKNINGDVCIRASGPTAALRVVLYPLTHCLKIGKYPWAVRLEGEVNSWCINTAFRIIFISFFRYWSYVKILRD